MAMNSVRARVRMGTALAVVGLLAAVAAPGAGAATTAAPTLGVQSISPSTIALGTPHASLGIIGRGFVDGMTAKLSRSGADVYDLTVYDPHVLRIFVRVSPDAPLGPRTLVLHSPNGQTHRCHACITIVAQPTATDAFPATVGQGAQEAGFNVNGTGFDRFVAVEVGNGVRVRYSGSARPTTVFVGVNVSVDAPLGPRDVLIVNANFGRVVCVACVTVVAGPALTSIDPPSVAAGAQHVQLTLTGTGFQPFMQVLRVGMGLRLESVHVTSSTEATVMVSVAPHTAARARSIVLLNPDHGRTKATGVLNVT